MGKNKRKKPSQRRQPALNNRLQRRKINIGMFIASELFGIILTAASLMAVLAGIFTVSMGIFGQIIRDFMTGLMSTSGLFVPFVPLIWGFAIIICKANPVLKKKLLSFLLVLLVFSCFMEVSIYNSDRFVNMSFIRIIRELYISGTDTYGGGLIAGIICLPLFAMFGSTGTIIILTAVAIIAIMNLTDISLGSILKYPRTLYLKNKSKRQEHASKKQALKLEAKSDNLQITDVSRGKPVMVHADDFEISAANIAKNKNVWDDADNTLQNVKNEPQSDMKASEDKIKSGKEKDIKGQEQENEKKEIEIIAPKKISVINESEHYIMPDPDLLKLPTNASKNAKSIKEAAVVGATKLEEVLSLFNVEAKVVKISPGPSVTRYELQPKAGTRVRDITRLSDDIALNMASYNVRIEAPIPGKDAIGIEVSNRETMIVHLREVISSIQFQKHASKIAVCLGKDLSGDNVIADISQMPHMIIAGATGSGKSVCINSIIISLLYKAKPDEVKMILIDPKVVELGVYNGIPHLMVPVVTNPKKASGALAWACTEMDSRYLKFAQLGVRDLKGYNAAIAAKTAIFSKLNINCEDQHQHLSDDELDENTDISPMPNIVIIIDELADLMMVSPKEVEDSICRLAQKARAAGIHLVVATQRPSTDVITGLIKANIPSKIAFAVSSMVDSRVILDMNGAERLLGKGDMLFHPIGRSKPLRAQGTYVDEEEISKVVEFVKQQASMNTDEDIMQQIEAAGKPDKEDGNIAADQILPDAIEFTVEAGRASASLIQRKFGVGYTRAARIIDQMEERGIIGGYEGSKPRQVLMTRAQLQEMKYNQENGNHDDESIEKND